MYFFLFLETTNRGSFLKKDNKDTFFNNLKTFEIFFFFLKGNKKGKSEETQKSQKTCTYCTIRQYHIFNNFILMKI